MVRVPRAHAREKGEKTYPLCRVLRKRYKICACSDRADGSEGCLVSVVQDPRSRSAKPVAEAAGSRRVRSRPDKRCRKAPIALGVLPVASSRNTDPSVWARGDLVKCKGRVFCWVVENGGRLQLRARVGQGPGEEGGVIGPSGLTVRRRYFSPACPDC